MAKLWPQSVLTHLKKLMSHSQKNLSLALKDLNDGFTGSLIWLYLAWQDTKQRYRRSLIGPFWITISTGVWIGAMGPLYGTLLGQGIGSYLQHLAVSLILWTFIAGFVNESCTAFIGAESYIKHIRLPYVTHVLRVLARNMILLAHNAIIVIVVLIFFPPTQIKFVPLMPLGMLLVLANLFWIGLISAILCARFRDISQIIANLVQVAFFLTPIIWQVSMLAKHQWIADFNPLFHLIEVVRAPLLGEAPSGLTWCWVIGMMLIGNLVALLLFSRFRSRIAYWV